VKTHWYEAAIYRRQRRSNLAQDIADQLRRRIVSGDLPMDHRLPSVSRLAELHGVSQPTAYAAVQILAALGFVRTRQGVGTFVQRGTGPVTAASHGWLHATLEELVMTRGTLDRMAATAAARHVADAAPARVAPTLRNLPFLAAERRVGRHAWAEVFVEADAAFHAAVARADQDRQVSAVTSRLVDERLRPSALAAADRLAGDEELNRWHDRLAVVILNGRAASAGHLAARIAAREGDAMIRTYRTSASRAALG
jgi:GntR family transcriptional regulator, transcriptional repressor for pyruvate dehydrogenase complex